MRTLRFMGSNTQHLLLISLLLLIGHTPPTGALTATQDSLLAEVDSLRVSYQVGSALTLLEELLLGARAINDSTYLLQILSHKGELQCSIGQVAECEVVLNEAILLAEAQNNTWRLCGGLRWLGVAVDTMGRRGEARAIYQRLLGLATANKIPLFQGWALVGMAWQDINSGRPRESLDKYRRALSFFEECGSIRGKSWSWNGMGCAQTDLGEYDSARQAYEQTRDLAIRSGDPMAESLAVNNLGSLAYSFGRPDQALADFTKARDLQLKMGYSRGAFQPTLNIALCQTILGRYRLAQTNLEALMEQCRRNNFEDLEVMAMNSMAALAFSRKRFNQSARLYRKSIADFPEQLCKNRTEARIGLARSQHYLGDTQAALATVEGGRRDAATNGSFIDKLTLEMEIGMYLLKTDRHSESLPILESVTETAAEQGLTGFQLQTLPLMAASRQALGQPDSSLALLREAARIWEVERGLLLDPEWRELRGEIGQQIYTDLAAQLLAMESEPDRMRQAYDQLQIFKGRTLLERMLGPGKTNSDPAAKFKTIDLAGLQQRVLDDGELLLDYFVGPNHSFLFAVTVEECRVVALPSERELDEKIRYLFDMISSPPSPSSQGSDLTIITGVSQALSEILLGEAREMLAGNRHIFYAPDGVLNLLPPALVFRQATGDSLPWARLPSATLLARIRDRKPTPTTDGTKSILAMAGGNHQTEEALPGAIKETAMLAGRFKHVTRQLHRSRSALTDRKINAADLSGFGLLHLGTHTDLDDQSPWNSTLYIDDRGELGAISAGEVAAANLDAQLAVLAACRTAGGRILAGEGVLGLTNAFISAGIPAVIATLWPVDDTCTARFMEYFYTDLATGRGAAAALQQARERLRGSPATAHPFFWAGYILVGDAGIKVPLEQKSPLQRHTRRLLLILGALLLLIPVFRPVLFPPRRRISPRSL